MFKVVPARADSAKYCSRKCLGKANSKRLIGNRHAVGSGGSSTSFKIGNEPWNKGLKGLHLSPDTEYKPGHENISLMPLSTVTIRIDKQKKRRRWIKMPDGWIEFAKIVWRIAHGPIPDGMLIHHKDRDTLNDDLDNLQLMNRAGHINEHRAEIMANRQP